MKLLLVANAHLYKDSEGNYYSPSVYNYNFLKRYLNVFDEIKFMGKILPIKDFDKDRCEVLSGEGVEVCEIPWYKGVKGIILRAYKIFPIFRNSYNDCDCIIYRMTQMESMLVYLFGGKHKPYAVEMVNDPDDWKYLPFIMRSFCVSLSKKMIKNARGLSFVTKSVLQKKYVKEAWKDGKFITNYSSVELDDSEIAKETMKFPKKGKFRIIHVANQINNYMKGHKTLIDAAKIVKNQGDDIEVIFVGEGEKIEEFRKYAISLGIGEDIHFIGRLNNISQVLNELRISSLMVFPSATEGLPRALIEAMSVGLPCLASPVGGIPELLEEEYLFDSNDGVGFGKKIIELMHDPCKMERMSEMNIIKAHEFSNKKLAEKRNWFYRKLSECVNLNIK